jgi:hypothetical protein
MPNVNSQFKLAHCVRTSQSAPFGSVPGGSSHASSTPNCPSKQLVEVLICSVHCSILPDVHPAPALARQYRVQRAVQFSTSPSYCRAQTGLHAASSAQLAIANA